MKRTIYDEGIQMDAVEIPAAALAEDQQRPGGKMITFVCGPNREAVAFMLPPEGVADLHSLTAPASGFTVERKMPPFPPPGE